MHLRFWVVPGNGEPFHFQPQTDTLVLGRGSSADLVIEDETVSRVHARVQRSGEVWLVEDCGSQNGTFLNGKEVREPTSLSAGDELHLSGSIITVEAIRAEEQDTSPESSVSYSNITSVFRNASEMISRNDMTDMSEDIAELRRFAQRFKLINHVHQTLATPISREMLMEKVLDPVFEHLKPEIGVIYLKAENGELVAAAMRSSNELPEAPCSQNLINEVVNKGMAALSNDILVDERFSLSESIVGAGIRSLVAAPLLDSEDTLGMIVLHSTSSRLFNEEDMELLVSIASAATLRLRNMMLNDAVEQQLRAANALLEEKVRERTKELEERNAEILRTRDRMVIQQKLASLGTLTRGISHEIANPLNFVNNLSQVSVEILNEVLRNLEPKCSEDEREDLHTLVKNLDMITRNGQRAADIVKLLRNMSVEDQKDLQTSDLNVVLAEYAALAVGSWVESGEDAVEVVTEYDERTVPVDVSQNLARAVINLFQNALEAVTYRKNKNEQGYQPRIKLATHLRNHHAEFTIEDNGSGIDSENLEHVIKPFFTTKPPGSGNVGLGLGVCYDIVVGEHQGDMRIESEKGSWTRVSILLPLSKEQIPLT